MRVLLSLLLIALWAGAANAKDVRAYVYGNSLVHHLHGDAPTNVPYWLNLLAKAEGNTLALDGQWGFLRDFASGPPAPNWSFKGVEGAIKSGKSFKTSGLNAVLITPANFVQYQSAERAYEGENPNGGSPLSASVEIVKRSSQALPNVPIYIYQGWAEMAGVTKKFPPNARGLKAYHTFNQGPYSDWFEDYHKALQASAPEADIRLIPVARILSRVLSETELSRLPAEEFYLDDAPHGTPSLYFLAAMITYSALYETPAPKGFRPAAPVHPQISAQYAEIAELIWQALDISPKEAKSLAPMRKSGETQSAKAQGVANPSMAMGLNGISDWSSQYPFINLMKTARPWVGHLPGQWGGVTAKDLVAQGALDAEGWPMRIPDGIDRLETFILSDLPEEATSLAARYRLTYDGKGRLNLVGRVANVRGRDGEIWFDFNPGDGLVAISLSRTDPESTGDYLRNIKVVREDHVALDEVGATFNPDWITRIRDLRVLRFMDWMFTNGSPITAWEQRPQLSDYTFVRAGVPLEVMIELANEIGADPWFSMPHMADDGFVKAFAEMTKARLDPRLKAYVEYSNELWNHGFPQAEWAAAQASERWGAAAGDDAWMQFAGMRAAEVSRIWGAVYGATAESRLIRVIATHTGWPGLEEPLLEAPLYVVEKAGNQAPATAFEAYAVSGYFGYDLGIDEMIPRLHKWLKTSRETAEIKARAEGLRRVALREAIAPVKFDLAFAPAAGAIRQGSLKELLKELYPYQAKVAQRYGLSMIMYEGGTHVTGHAAHADDEELTDFYTTFNYSDEMGALYAELLAGWQAAGGTLFNGFVDVSVPSKWGSWGALRHLDDNTPRWDALISYNAQNPAIWESRETGTFLHGVLRKGSAGGETLSGTPEEDILLGFEGDDVLISHGGNDRLHGGAGDDIAVLPGARADYSFAMKSGALVVSGAHGTVRLVEIEALRFAGEAGRIYRLQLPD